LNPAIAARLASIEAQLGMNRDQAAVEAEAAMMREALLDEARRHVIARVNAVRSLADVDQIRAELEAAMNRVSRR
jgi:hypothetical protein